MTRRIGCCRWRSGRRGIRKREKTSVLMKTFLEIPNSKFQIPGKSQIPDSKLSPRAKRGSGEGCPARSRTGHASLRFETWNFSGIWNLEFGIFLLAILLCLTPPASADVGEEAGLVEILNGNYSLQDK